MLAACVSGTLICSLQNERNGVSIQSVEEDVASLERDVHALANDADRLVGDVRDQARTLRNEAMAAHRH